MTEPAVLIRGMSLLEGLTLVTEPTLLIRGVSLLEVLTLVITHFVIIYYTFFIILDLSDLNLSLDRNSFK